jgi:hypothetical protein
MIIKMIMDRKVSASNITSHVKVVPSIIAVLLAHSL